MGECAAFTASVIVANLPITAKWLDPTKINPYRAPAPESEKMRRVKEAISRIAWRVLTDEMRAK
jgi:hypothetical protein